MLVKANTASTTPMIILYTANTLIGFFFKKFTNFYITIIDTIKATINPTTKAIHNVGVIIE